MKSWIESANDPECDFPLNNLPMGVFSLDHGEPRCCTAIGKFVLDLTGLEDARIIQGSDGEMFQTSALNCFMAQGEKAWASLRSQLQTLLSDGSSISSEQKIIKNFLHPAQTVEMHLPFKVSEYTDFYACKNHAFNVGTMLRGKENALPPNYFHIPIGYNGRASTVVVGGTKIVRPKGQIKPPKKEHPIYAPSSRLDMELEIGAVVGLPSEMGHPISLEEAEAMIFGYVLLNDWSARDIQAFEYQPLGPFQAKAFATSIGPWVITKAALEPFRVSTPNRVKPLLAYLEDTGPMLYNINLAIEIQTASLHSATIISKTNYKEMYYSAAQQLTHHASSGCAMNTGDLLGSGTISGSQSSSYGSFMELSWGGEKPIELPSGETRSFLHDGDKITLKGHCQGNGYRIGFGECSGEILPALK
ncbi:MAG: fumarylacetoacetase [Rhizobiaceae bacterium]